ncbi:hypothetical protein [Yonghaparkia sp. Soil809]|uniref:hypothetical protein n=1 Tax=Yonghaparkia sp. Soil809 TaxID=1736417 RepID=UPI0006F75E7B|nr:hypothetical protein [Yonghaparkia sp. Soil809]KRF31198.1 hypothetical protein ASG83_10365 [Yonghaparkia sp. Soil809]
MTTDGTAPAPAHARQRASARSPEHRAAVTALALSALALSPMPALEWSTASHAGRFEPLFSWSHLARLVRALGSTGMPYLVVQRTTDPGERFVQCLGTRARLIVEIGARDAVSRRHAVQRVRQGSPRGETIDVHPEADRRQPVDLSELLTADQFLRIAHDWLTLGVVPGFDLDPVPLA